MIQINPLKSYIDGGVRAAITTPPSASLVFDLPGKAIWVKGVKLKGTDHTYTFSHDNYITLTNTPDSNESEDIKIGVNTSALKSAIDTTYGVVSTTANGLAPKFTSGNKLAASAATTYYFLGWAGSTLKWYQAPFRNIRINSETTDRLGVNNTDPLIIGSGNGISVTWDSTNKKIVITNTKPDINHNTHYTTMLYIGENNDTKANKNVANPYLKLFDDNTRRATFQIKAGSGIAVASDANGNITITNSSPDVNHNTDRTGIKLTTVSGTKKTDSTLILANSTTGLNIQGGTNKFLIGNGTNYIEVPVVPSVSNKDATIGTTLTTIATIAGVDIKAKIASYSLSNHTHSIKINGSTKTIAASGAVDLGSYLPLSGGTMILGEGLKFHANENYFGTNLDARIISLLDGNGTTCDGGLIIDERCTSNGTEYVTELLRIRDAEFKWKGLNILHAGNSDVSGGGNTWGSSITVKVNGTSKTLTIPGNPNTDYRVTQSETTTSNYRPLVVGYTNVSTAGSGMTGSVTNQVYLSNKFYVQPSTGNLYATTFVGLLLGNAATSSKWITARTLNLTGSVTGSASFDGSGNIILATTTNHTHSLYLPLAGGTMTGSICSDSGYVILNPIKASYHTTTSTVLGCITINLPANVGNTMISMWIDVYIYEYQKSFSVHCGGYTYNNSTWVNSPFATVYGANHRVRLGHNGTQFVVYIGETNTKWSYPQVSVRNVTLGFSPTLSNWAKAWSVSFSTSVSNVTYDTTTYAWTTKNLSKGEFATAGHTHSNYVTALGISGNYLTWVKNGSTNNITIPFSSTTHKILASLNLDSIDKANEFRDKSTKSLLVGYLANNVFTGLSDGIILSASVPKQWCHQMHLDDNRLKISHRCRIDDNTGWSNWYLLLDTFNSSISGGGSTGGSSITVTLANTSKTLTIPTSLPASDVYDWAKQSTKPTYNFSEIIPGIATIGDGSNRLMFRTNESYRNGIYYSTPGNEALVFGTKYSVTSWIFATTDPNSQTAWTSLIPSLQIKNGRVTINKLIANATNASYNLDVNGSANATALYENGIRVSINGHTHNYLPLSGGILTGTLTTVTTGTDSYNQGIRINRTTTNQWATLLIGKSGTATSGTGTGTAGDGAWLIATPAGSNSLIFNLNSASEAAGLCLKGHGVNDMKWNNNTILHAGNYNAYSPTLTGSGASGTWGINITGNAASATKANTTYGLLTNNTSQSADSCYDGNPGLHFYRYNGTSNTTGQGGGDGWILLWSWNPGSVGGQIYLDDNPSKTMCIRGYNNKNSSFTTWDTFLHSGNYTTYTVKKDGTGASGTWNISVSGNAATATNADTVDGYHATNFLAWSSLQGIGSGSPFQDAVNFFNNLSNLNNGGKLVYNHYGTEYTELFTRRRDSTAHGTILKWGYADRYIRIIRMVNGVAQSTDWEKISAGYADSSGNADTVDGLHYSSFLRKDTNDSTPCQYTFTKTNDHAIKVGTVRGTAVGSQTGEYIHLYERVAIGSPSGWGSRPAPSYGLATYGGAWLATDTGNVTIGGTNQLSSAWGSFNLTIGNNTNKVVIGYLNSSTNGVVVGGHNNALSAWAPLNIAGTTLYFRINETIKATLDPNGNIGIGIISPSYKLHVVGDIYTTTGFKKNGSSNSYVLLGGGGHKAESSLTVNYANTASGLDFNRTTITTGAIGWYKLAYYASTDPRGSVRIGLITTGGNFIPYYAELYVKNGWSVIDMVLYGRFDYISKFRFTSDSSNCYIEGYFPTANTVITLQKIKGASYVSDHTSGWNLYTTATAGSGTVQESEYTRSSLSSGIYTNRIIEGIGFVKTNSSNSYVLLGGGGHKAESSLSVNYANSAGNADTVDGYHANGLFTALSNSNNGINITIGGTTKSISNISVNYANSATSLGQGALKHMCSLYTTGTYNAYKITTGWHKSSNKMPTINIRGYAYGSVRTIDCDIIMYHYDNTPCNYSLTNKGSYPIRVWQAIENDVQVFYINPGEYYGMFNVFVYGGMGTDAFSNWSMTTVNAVSGTEIGSKPIATSITGNASSSTIASTVTVNNSDANSTYRMVWHSGNTLYGTNNIYCNPSSDQIYSAGFRHVNYNSASYLLRSDGGAAAFNWSGQSGQPTWLWGGNSQHTYYVYNPSNFNVNSAAVLRGNASNPNNSHPGHGAKVFYSWNTGQAGNDTTGYSNGITIGSNPGDTAYGFQIVQNMWDDRTYTRRYNKGWQSWKTLAWTSDIPTVTNYYWANIKVSASSNAYTTPQFGNVTIFDGTNSYLYLKTATAGSYAYLASYNTGGQYGADVVLHSGSSMVLGAGESAAAMYSNNVDSLRGSENLYLTADGSIKIFTNCDSIANRKYVARFDTTGYTYFNSYINIGGHEKNASSPTYVWGSNSSDTYLRSYQTSSLSVSKAVNADYSRYVYCTSGKYLNFQWSGQSGLPTWLFGSNDGANVYVWNPSNFSVYKANKSDQLEAYTGSGFTGGNHFVRAIRYDSWHTRLYMGYYRDTTLLNTIHVGYADNATIATTASLLNNTSVSDPNTAASGLNVKWYSQISQSSGYAGTNYGFPVSNNANGILWLGTHSGPFGWQMGFSSNGRIYARYISNNSFSTAANGGSWGKIAWTSDIPTVTNYYWANVKVSSSSSISTSPTFSTCYTSNWFRSTGLSGWYNETYGGGWYMNDVTWIRTHNNKGIYTSTGTIYNAGHAWLATSSGYNVGIGTTSPSYKLHVSGDSYTTGWSRAASGFYCQDTGVHFTHNGTKGQIAIISNNEFCWGANSNVLHFNYALPSLGTTVTLYVWNAGNSSSYASHTTGHITLGNSGYLIKRVGCSVSWVNGRNSAIVRQTSANGYSVVVSSKTTNGSWEIGNYTGNGDSLYFTYITDSNYNSGNNTFSGQVYFDTSGTFYASNLSASNWVYANNIEISDDAFIYGNVNTSGSTYAAHFYENSDIRYKKILRNLSINSNTIANLPLFDFEWIENNAIGTGTSALAVLLILPNLVSGTDKLTLDYGVLGTIAGITACKELVTQKSELLQLKEKVKLLEDKLRKYENI